MVRAFYFSPEATPSLLRPPVIIFASRVHASLIVDSAIDGIVDHPRALNVIADGAGIGRCWQIRWMTRRRGRRGWLRAELDRDRGRPNWAVGRVDFVDLD